MLNPIYDLNHIGLNNRMLHFLELLLETTMRIIFFAFIATTLIGAAYIATADDFRQKLEINHAEHHDHGNAPANPSEAGQGAFAALVEIVVLLENDPHTDWGKVDIDGLREHLVDMNQLVINAKVSKHLSEDKVAFTISGTGAALRAINNMVPAHAGQLSMLTQWEVETQLNADGVTLVLSSKDKDEIKKISALGFFGVMATGSHHQEHHYQMAKGKGHFH
ncbi:MAG: hypothetical protein ACI9NY_000400 [Kiritimatiellia bacterium]|jgi:hypothetical protein